LFDMTRKPAMLKGLLRKYGLVIVDLYSKFAQAIALANKEGSLGTIAVVV
jgi:hypothetical protein